MKVTNEKRWVIVAFKHPDLEHSVFYRKGIKHLERAVTRAIENGANLMSIRGFDYTIEEPDPEVEPDQKTLT